MSEEEIISEELKNNIKELIKLLYQDRLTQEGKRQLEAHIKNMWVAYEGQTEILHEVNDLYNKEKETSHYNQSQLDIANAKLLEEKEKNKKLGKEFNEETKTAINLVLNDYYVSKDKIKDKLEELQKKLDEADLGGFVDEVQDIKDDLLKE